MGSHFNAETVGTDTFDFVGLVDSFWHGFILSLMSGAYYTLKKNYLKKFLRRSGTLM
jgi:hypothetical protein